MSDSQFDMLLFIGFFIMAIVASIVRVWPVAIAMSFAVGIALRDAI